MALFRIHYSENIKFSTSTRLEDQTTFSEMLAIRFIHDPHILSNMQPMHRY
jgi:hypothetical protein